MRVIVTSHGSTGDIYPVIALAVALRDAGHDTVFATLPVYREEIGRAGVAFYPLCSDDHEIALQSWMGRLQKLHSPIAQLREVFRCALPLMPELIARTGRVLEGADLLVSSYLFPMNKGLADRRGVPFATLSFAHQTVPSPDYPPENIVSPRWLPGAARRAWNAFLWRAANRIVDRVINRAVRRPLRAAGLPPVRGFFSAPAARVIVAVSEKLMRPRAAIDPRFRFTGYCRWQAPEDARLEAELRAFTGGEKAPVLTFGSMVYPDAAAWMRRLAAAWPRGKKLVVQRGWAGFEAPAGRGEIKVVGRVSHDQLFRHASAVIHHGGAGTTASALHAGAPQLVAPHIGDQFFFGREVARLGCGLRIAKKHWPEQLAAALARLDAAPGFAAAAARARAVLASENGPARAVEELERFVAETKPPAPPPAPRTVEV
ncbi:MAG: glycosyltransferase [Opitutaceae bacterium]|jgi:vancomycin aglycone glucosyltransferase|nr:glycosyltransferase [Opitutaceae bacterium]